MHCVRPLFAILLAAAGFARGAAQFTITDLGAIGGNYSQASAINASGVITGSSGVSTFGTPVVYSGGAWHSLGLLSGTSAGWATAINASGSITGYCYVAPNNNRGFLVSGGVMTQIVNTIGGTDCEPQAINASGQIAGTATTNSGNVISHAFFYSGGVMHDLGTLGGAKSYAYALNDSGQVVGAAQTTGSTSTHAFLYSGGTMHDLGTGGGDFSFANAINASGMVAGRFSNTAAEQDRAFLYMNGTMHDLGTTGGYYSSSAYGINASGIVVGTLMTPYSSTPDHAFLYADGAMHDLNDLVPSGNGWILNVALAVNDSARIVGYGSNPNGYHHGFLLTPIPASLTIAGKKKLLTKKSKITLKGSASGYVTDATAQVGKKTLTVTGTTSWKLTVPLKPGRTRVTIVAHGPGGDSAPVKIVITRK